MAKYVVPLFINVDAHAQGVYKQRHQPYFFRKNFNTSMDM